MRKGSGKTVDVCREAGPGPLEATKEKMSGQEKKK